MDGVRHQGRVAIVTGTGSGIGQAVALRLAKEGAAVVGCDISTARLDTTLERIQAAGKHATMLPADITSQADVDRVVDETLAGHGRSMCSPTSPGS